MSLGEYIKTLRHRRGLSQWELSRLSGLTRSHLSRLELDDFENPSAETFLALARALKVHPNDLYEAAGYIEEHSRFRRSLSETPEEAFDELEQISLEPVSVLNNSIFEESAAGQSSRSGHEGVENKKIVGILARGFSLEPEIREGDIIFINREQAPSPGNVVLAYQSDKVQLMRYDNTPRMNGHSNEDFQIYGVVIGLNRKLN